MGWGFLAWILCFFPPPAFWGGLLRIGWPPAFRVVLMLSRTQCMTTRSGPARPLHGRGGVSAGGGADLVLVAVLVFVSHDTRERRLYRRRLCGPRPGCSLSYGWVPHPGSILIWGLGVGRGKGGVLGEWWVRVSDRATFCLPLSCRLRRLRTPTPPCYPCGVCGHQRAHTRAHTRTRLFFFFFFFCPCAGGGQVSCALAWVMCISLQVRNEIVLHSGDVYMRVVIFWAFFMPLGKVRCRGVRWWWRWWWWCWMIVDVVVMRLGVCGCCCCCCSTECRMGLNCGWVNQINFAPS